MNQLMKLWRLASLKPIGQVERLEIQKRVNKLIVQS